MKSVFRRLTFEKLPRSDVLIFDANGANIISEHVLDGIPHAVMHARFEKIYARPSILLGMIANVRRLRIDDMPPRWFFDPRMMALQLRNLYFLACLSAIKPKVVLTTVDTHFYFQRCSRTYLDATFIATMNGFRDVQALGPPFLPAPPHPASKTSMTHLYCCGQADIDTYCQMNQDVDHMYPLGTLRGGVHVQRRLQSPTVPTYDISIVSQWRRNMFGNEWRPELRRGYALTTLMQFLCRYVRETNARTCVALVHADGPDFADESTFYREHLGDGVDLIPNRRGDYTSYRAVDMGEVVISAWSTLGVEAFGWGKRALMCNFKGDPKGYLPRLGLWSLTEPDYEKFKERLDRIRAMTDEEYWKECGEVARYMIGFDPNNLAHVAIHRHVLTCIGQPADTETSVPSR